MRPAGENAVTLARRRTLALAAVVLAWPAPRRAVLAQEQPMAEVAAIQGLVQVLRAGRFEELAAGSPLFPNDILRTGADGRVRVRCPDGLQLLVGSGTELALRGYLLDRPRGMLRATFGILRGIVRLIGGATAPRQWIEVDTRTAVASVRSTEWLLDVTPRGTGVLSVEGVVEVQALAGGRVSLRPGEGTDVPPGGPPRPAARWGEARRRDGLARTTI